MPKKRDHSTQGHKRTTVVFSPRDMDNIEVLRELQGGITTTAAIHRAIALARELIEFDGDIILKKGRKREIIRFM